MAVIFITSITSAFAEKKAEQVDQAIKNAAPYVMGVAFGMSRLKVENQLGKKADQINRSELGDTTSALWQLEDRRVSVNFDSQDHVIAYSVHWTGPDHLIPSFSDILPAGVEEKSRRGARIVEIEAEEKSIRWTRMSIPGGEHVISILTIRNISSY